MSLSYESYDSLLKDWWEANDPRVLREIRFVGFSGFGVNEEITYVAHVYVDTTTEDVLVLRQTVLKSDFKKFVMKDV